MGRTTEEIRERIEIKKRKVNRELTDKEIRSITKSVKSKVRRENIVRGLFLSLGLAVGAGGHTLLTAGKNNEGPAIETQGQNESDTTNERMSFIGNLKIDLNTLSPEEERILFSMEVKDKIEKEVDSLKTQQDVLMFLKGIYVNEYNERNEETIEVEQLKLYKNWAKQEDLEKKIHYDVAQNGDEIIRQGGSEKSEEKIYSGVQCFLEAEIERDGERYREYAVSQHSEYRTMYSSDEIVNKDEKNLIAELGTLMGAGIDYITAIGQKENSEKTKEMYKNRLVEALVDYKQRQVNELMEEEIGR